MNTWVSPSDAQAYLACTSAILKTEIIHGTGLPVSLGLAPISNVSSGKVSWGWSIPNVVVDKTTTYENWNLTSWANPGGLLSIPVNPVATKITTTDPLLPMETRIQSVWDTWGPTQTDDYSNPVNTVPSVSGTTTGVWTAPVPPADPIQRTNMLTRTMDPNVGLLLTQTTQETLSGPGLPALRTGTNGLVDFGTTTNIYEQGPTSLGRVQTISAVRGAYISKEDRQVPGPGLRWSKM